MDADSVTTLVDVLQLSHGDAQSSSLLTEVCQKFNNDASRAVQEYFENPDVLKQAVSLLMRTLAP